MKALVRVSLAALTLLGICGAAAQPGTGTASGGTPGEKAPAADQPGVSEAAVVRLLEPGAEPRRQLRYKPAVGDHYLMSMTMNIEQKMEMGGNPLPSTPMPGTVMTYDIKILEVRPDGDIKYALNLTKADIDSKNEDPMSQAMRGGLKTMVGMAGTVVVTSRGDTKDVDFKLPEGAEPMAAAFLEQMKGSARQMSMPLPEEAVGLGAKWEVENKVKTSGATITQTAALTLKEVSEDAFVLGVAMTQKARDQMIESPMGQIELAELDGTGEGTIHATTKKLVPTKSEISMKSKQVMKAGGQSVDVQTNLKIKMSTSDPAPEGDSSESSGTK